MADVQVSVEIGDQVSSGGVDVKMVVENNENREVTVDLVLKEDGPDGSQVEQSDGISLNPLAATSIHTTVLAERARNGLVAYIDRAKFPGEPTNPDNPHSAWPEWMGDI